MGDLLKEIKERAFSKYKKDGWEVKTLEEIATQIISGSEVTKEQLGKGDHPAIRAGDINSSLPLQFKECISFVDEESIKDKKCFSCGDILISNIGNTISKVGISTTYLGDKEGFAGVGVNIIKHKENPSYLSYSLSTKFVRDQIKKLAQKSTVYRLYPSTIKQIKIPLPPLEIQNEIVEFLDKFTELEKELEMRKEQYEYYKELVFNRGINEENWEWKTIGEIATEIISGNGVTREQLGTGDYPAIKCGDINSSLPQQFEECISFVDPNLIKKPKYFEKGDILISKMSNKTSNIGTASTYLSNDKGLLGGDIDAIKHNQNPKYLTYVLSTKRVRKQIEDLVQESTVFHLYTKNIKQIQIPIPSLKEQDKVVEKLDIFYKITNDLKEGIPLLIQKNREQYNFYKEIVLER